ncbi:MAG: DUF2914 domain-containing protein [Sandaracinaceae bacterium]|nr:DUF2914 domain-containing protein [Sandaracinaceae bacterium]
MRRRGWIVVVGALALGVAGLAAAQEGELSVTEIVLGSQVENGVPTPAATSFARTDRAVYCMVRLENPSREAGTLRFAFERAEGDPAERAGTGLAIEYPARPRYRTLARGTLNRPPGQYRCVVRTEEGRVLSHADFTVTE